MCYLCEDDGAYCQDCGKEICFDLEVGDDFSRPAYVTASGDLFCDRCGSAIDEEEEAEYDDEYGWDFDPYEVDIHEAE